MRIKSHKVEGITFNAAQWTGEIITPGIVVLHDTASHLDHGNAAAYLQRNTAKVSVHFVVERNGTITQQVPTNRRANHAGQSSWQGRSGCNGFSIGIEIVNPGKLTPVAKGGLAWFGQIFDETEGVLAMTTPQHGAGAWLPYTSEQMRAVEDLLICLFRDIKSLTDITTHWFISPGRKVDTNPLFPLEAIRARVLGRDDPAEIAAERASEPVHPDEHMVQIEAGGTTLNLRSWPSFNPNVIAAIPDGTVVPVLRRGLFAGREWLRVLFDGREGWIVSRYAAPITFSQP
jgi:N-acetylmuramoyl-L-alanine amidase